MKHRLSRFIAFLVSKWGDSRLSGYSRARCPWCDQYRVHSPLCVCATREEILAAYAEAKGRYDGLLQSTDRNIRVWVSHYEREKAANTVLKHENNKLRAAKWPARTP